VICAPRPLRRRLAACLVALLPASAASSQPTGISDPEVERAYALLRSGQIEAAQALLEAKLEAAPGHGEALYVAGLALLAQGRAAEAATRLERSLAADPGSPAARELGLIRGSQGRLRDCLLLLRGWFADHPLDVEAGAAAAFCALEAFRAEDARSLIDRLPADLPVARLLRGRLLLFDSRPGPALEVLRPALAEAEGAMEVDVRRLMAEASLALGEAEAAVELLSGFDRTPQLATYLAEAQFQLGDLEAAAATLRPWAERALDGRQDGPAAATAALLRDYARLLLQAERAGEAVPCLELATRLTPDDKQPWLLLGQALALSGRRSEAEGALAEFRRLADQEPPESIKDRTATQQLRDPTQAAVREATALAGDGRLQEAIALLDEEARLVPDDVRPPLTAARLLLDHGLPDRALAAADAAHRAAPASPLPDYERGRALAALGRPQEAIAALRAALAEAPELADALVELAALEMDQGAEESARRHLERALDLEPGHAAGRRLAAEWDGRDDS
jgi:tetratricopeptide (TPR) repeat protein